MLNRLTKAKPNDGGDDGARLWCEWQGDVGSCKETGEMMELHEDEGEKGEDEDEGDAGALSKWRWF